MSFRQFGGLQFASKHNAVSSYYNTSNNLLVTQNVGQSNSYINFLSDISGNIRVYGNFDLSGNMTANEFYISGPLSTAPNSVVPKSYVDKIKENSIVYFDQNVAIIFDYYPEEREVYISNEKIWSVLSIFNLKYDEIQKIISKWLSKNYNINRVYIYKISDINLKKI